jgi:hypothetical protein
MIPSRIRYLVVLGLLAACRDKPPKEASINETLPNLPLPPGATFVSRTGTPDALQIVVQSPSSVETVVDYYRAVLKRGGWKLVSDAKDADGAVVLLADQDGPPLWVRIRRVSGGPGTIVELTGAVLDTTGTKSGTKRAS